MNRPVERKFSTRIYLGNVWVRPLAGGALMEANAINLSRGGLTLFSSRFLEVGQLVELVLHGGAGGGSGSDYTFPGQVTQVRVETEGNLIDIAFSRVLSNDEMQELETKLGIKARR